ncbi:MAG: hypothetical protein GX591_16575 [Planctomycetes bacterium]|nr:hypothetical protein [Planctomycetota bacterium]
MVEPTIHVWYGRHQRFAAAGHASRFVNIVGSVAPAREIHAVAYQLNGGRLTPLPLGPTAFRLLGEGDFNVELESADLAPGANTLTLRAVSRQGGQSSVDVTIDYVPDAPVPPLPWTVRWADAASVPDLAQVIDGHWTLTDGGLRTVEIGYDRLAAVGDVGWRDVVVTVPITIHRYTDLPAAYGWPSHGAGVGVLLRWQGHSDWHDLMPRRGYLPFGAIAWGAIGTGDADRRMQLYSGADGSTLAKRSDRVIPVGSPTMLKAAVQSQEGRPSLYRMKLWPAGAAEPSGWDLQAENLDGELDSGSVVLLAHHTDATFGDVLIEPLA